AYEWVESEAQRVKKPREWDPDPASWLGNVALEDMKGFVHGRVREVVSKPFGDTQAGKDWKVEREEWSQALTKFGIVSRKNDRGRPNRSLELWRATLEVDGYVCCEESTREQLRNLLHGVQSFSKSPRYHVSCMLIASPGSGKTFLAKRLAETADLRFIP